VPHKVLNSESPLLGRLRNMLEEIGSHTQQLLFSKLSHSSTSHLPEISFHSPHSRKDMKTTKGRKWRVKTSSIYEAKHRKM
jgi:hypothetical protein